MLKKSWQKYVGEVFNVQPRDGNEESTVWVVRKELEQRFEKYISIPGVHLCLDGPTGTGKTSLAKTILKRKNINYKRVAITKSTTWIELCFNIIGWKNYISSTRSAKVDIGIQKGLPTVLFQIAIGKSKSNIDDEILREKISKTITESKLCEVMAEVNESLFIDDFEKASDELVTRIADMCKLLTDSYVASNAKLIIVGTDDIYARLTNASIALEERLSEISIGTFADKYESWRFLYLGFEKLKIENPVTDYKKKYIDKKTLLKCVQKVYDAANGLPKSLNSLGVDICMNAGYDRKRVSVADVINTAEKND